MTTDTTPHGATHGRITNTQRATWAQQSVWAYARLKDVGTSGPDQLYDTADLVLSDFLADVMHYAAQEQIDWPLCLERATVHYEAETREEPAMEAPQPSLALDLYDDVEIQPVREHKEDRSCEPVPEAPHTATLWTVYGHLNEGGVNALVDCTDERSAQVCAEMLKAALLSRKMLHALERFVRVTAIGFDARSESEEAEAWVEADGLIAQARRRT